MTSWHKPTEDEVSRAVAQLVHPEHRRYFLTRLENPEWIAPLWHRGFFTSPPEPQRTPDGSWKNQIWPDSQFLKRMAEIPEAQSLVCEIVNAIPKTSNWAVNLDLAEICAILPGKMAKGLVDKAKSWVCSPGSESFAFKVGETVCHLARDGEVASALDLARTLFELVAPPRPKGDPKMEAYQTAFRDEPGSHYGPWEYREVLMRCLPDLVRYAGVDALRLFCDLLETCLDLSPSRGPAPRDHSSIWRSAIEQEEDVTPDKTGDALITAVRDAARQIVDLNSSTIREVLEVLESGKWTVFARIGFYVLSLFPEHDPELTIAHVAKGMVSIEHETLHEFNLLLRASFPALPTEAKQTVLQAINDGPALNEWETRMAEWYGEHPSDEEKQKYLKVWQRDRLAQLSGTLPAEYREWYDSLVAELGEPREEHLARGGTWVGPTSPKTGKELQNMTIDELHRYLTSWIWPHEIMGPSPGGLGRELAGMVEASPEKYAPAALKFQDTDVTYIRSILDGLRRAADKNQRFPWENVLALCQFAVGQPREIAERVAGSLDIDPDWGWTRGVIADLMKSGCDSGAQEIPISERKRVWDIVSGICEDSEPTPEYEKQYGGDNMDPFTLSINTVRGRAMHAVMSYALWVYRDSKSKGCADQGFAVMPEVETLLDRHLDPSNDPSLAVRAVYGQGFPWLVLIDPQWSEKNMARMFPEGDQDGLRDAAWDAYVVYCPPYSTVFALMREEYRKAILRLPGKMSSGPLMHTPESSLIEHLVSFYWRGEVALGSGDLLDLFLHVADTEFKAHAMDCVGRSLCERERETGSDVIDRLKNLWETRVNAVRSRATKESASELSPFGWWFVSGRFEETWALENLKVALELSGTVEDERSVSERLAEISGRRPLEAIECLGLLVQGLSHEWGFALIETEAKRVLQTVMSSGDARARLQTRRLINDLGAKGYLGFRDLL